MRSPVGARHAGLLPSRPHTRPSAALPSHTWQDTFWGSLAAPRVLDSFRNLQAGKELKKEWPGAGLTLERRVGRLLYGGARSVAVA